MHFINGMLSKLAKGVCLRWRQRICVGLRNAPYLLIWFKGCYVDLTTVLRRVPTLKVSSAGKNWENSKDSLVATILYECNKLFIGLCIQLDLIWLWFGTIWLLLRWCEARRFTGEDVRSATINQTMWSACPAWLNQRRIGILKWWTKLCANKISNL